MKQHEEHHYHHYNYQRLIIQIVVAILSLILFSNILGWVTSEISEDKTIYKQCTNSCSVKHFQGLKIGTDRPSNPYVIEYDRTHCLSNCNELYLGLQ